MVAPEAQDVAHHAAMEEPCPTSGDPPLRDTDDEPSAKSQAADDASTRMNAEAEAEAVDAPLPGMDAGLASDTSGDQDPSDRQPAAAEKTSTATEDASKAAAAISPGKDEIPTSLADGSGSASGEEQKESAPVPMQVDEVLPISGGCRRGP